MAITSLDVHVVESAPLFFVRATLDGGAEREFAARFGPSASCAPIWRLAPAAGPTAPRGYKARPSACGSAALGRRRRALAQWLAAACAIARADDGGALRYGLGAWLSGCVPGGRLSSVRCEGRVADVTPAAPTDPHAAISPAPAEPARGRRLRSASMAPPTAPSDADAATTPPPPVVVAASRWRRRSASMAPPSEPTDGGERGGLSALVVWDALAPASRAEPLRGDAYRRWHTAPRACTETSASQLLSATGRRRSRRMLAPTGGCIAPCSSCGSIEPCRGRWRRATARRRRLRPRRGRPSVAAADARAPTLFVMASCTCCCRSLRCSSFVPSARARARHRARARVRGGRGRVGPKREPWTLTRLPRTPPKRRAAGRAPLRRLIGTLPLSEITTIRATQATALSEARSGGHARAMAHARAGAGDGASARPHGFTFRAARPPAPRAGRAK